MFGVAGALAVCWVAAGPASAQLVVGCTNGSLPMLVYRTDTGQYAPSIDVGNLAVRGLDANAVGLGWESVVPGAVRPAAAAGAGGVVQR